MDSSRDYGVFGVPGTLGESGPRFDGSALGTMQGVALRKALNLWERVDALEKWARKARRGGIPPVGAAPHFAALPADYPPVCPALVFVPAEQLPRGHPDFR